MEDERTERGGIVMSEAALPHLFQPLRIRGMEIRNRIYSSPHGTNYNSPGDGGMFPNEREMYYQAEKARGGCGFQMMGANLVHPSSANSQRMPSAFSDGIIPAYRAIADAVHRHGGKIGVQLSYIGAAGDGGNTLNELRAPSDVATDIHKETPHALSIDELDEIRQAYGRAAARVRAAGMDAVMVHGGHGYLVNQTLSPVFNKRTDKYGGSVERRAQFVIEVLQTIREAVGPDFPVGLRMSVAEFLEGGMTAEDSGQVAHLLDLLGLVDWFDCSWGSDTNWLARSYHYSPMYVPHGAQVDLAAAIKAVVSKPVAAVGRVVDPRMADRIIAEGKADLVAMTRAQIADPHLAAKAREGRFDDIRPCIGANDGCVGRTVRGLSIICVSRASTGREKDWADVPPADAQRRVVVVGGGPAGLEAARVAALRGHEVILLERATRLGGQMHLAAALPGRAEVFGIVTWLIRQAEQLGVDVRLGQEATVESVRALQPDAVIVATGASARSAAFPGAEGRVVEPRAVLEGAPVREKVVLLDGEAYLAGLGTADLLAEQGKQVTVLCRDFQPGERIDYYTRTLLLKRLYERDVRIEPFTWLRRYELNGDGGHAVVYHTLTGRERPLEADTIVAALGGVAEASLYEELRHVLANVHAVGDCRAPRRLENAIHEAFSAAVEI